MAMKYRLTTNYFSLWGNKGRARYLEVYKNLGFWDICECEDYHNVPKRMRPDTGRVGQTECKVCSHLVWPLALIYDCDDCMEPTLADKYPVEIDEVFLCSDCQ